MRKKQTPYACYDDMLNDYYGCIRPASRRKRRAVSRNFDNGEVLVSKDAVPAEEYVVAAAVDEDGNFFDEYVVASSATDEPAAAEEYVVLSASYSDDSYTNDIQEEIHLSPVSHHQDLLTNVLEPDTDSGNTSYTYASDIAAAPVSSAKPVPSPAADNTTTHPDTDALLDDIKQMRSAEAPPPDSSSTLSEKEQEIANDLQAILSGKKVYDPATKRTVNREDLGKQQSVEAPTPPKEQDPGFKNEHAIFDRIAQNMKYANAYNLGTIQVDTEELNNRFNEFEQTPPAKRSTPQPAAAAQSVTRKDNPYSIQEDFNPAEFMQDLDEMRKKQSPSDTPPPSDVVATVEAAPQPAVTAQQVATPAAPAADPNWPPRPTSIRPLSTAERATEFGTFTYEADPSTFNGDGIRVTNSWYHDNIIPVSIPQLNGKRFGSRVIQNGTINFHRAGADRLRRLWAAWETAGLLDRITTFEGGYAARYIRGTRDRNPRPLSNHAWGTAFDINAPWNALGSEPALVGQTGCVRELVAIANQHGFFWGGHFRSRKDGMHFELGRTV
ncbi:M15 family metallopeptidase [Chitinophaga sp. Mgbs1]|uniref:M15 family metallopeptidase n=1 Tax=Chitinophaga solisilvae TaxID=1233460 RepID=A0A3S1CTV3_9BACT|nr:M15 family metallopeptidase [Chitinophaga solisilvae]